MSFALTFLLTACNAASDAEAEVAWAGWVLVDQDREQVVADGGLSFWLEGAEEPVEGGQPYEESYPGYWQVLLPAGAPVSVRVDSAGAARPTWWAGDAPLTAGSWFTGALFAATDSWLGSLLSALGEDTEAWLAAGADGVLVIGYPANEALVCGDLTVGASGTTTQPTCWSVDEVGVVRASAPADPVAWFVAVAEPGEVVVAMAGAEERWTAEPGDLILPWYLVGGGS
jgi:hypothetical protein